MEAPASVEGTPTAVCVGMAGLEPSVNRVRLSLSLSLSSLSSLSLPPTYTDPQTHTHTHISKLSSLPHSQGDPQLSAPVLVKPPQTVFAELYTDVELECEAVGNPEPVLTWFRDGLEIEGATQKTLVVDEVGISDRAVYHCTAANSQGSVTSDGAYLNIIGLYGCTYVHP